MDNRKWKIERTRQVEKGIEIEVNEILIFQLIAVKNLAGR
jgi:hypothetical protein